MRTLHRSYTLLLRWLLLCSLLACTANGYAQTTTTWRPANLETDDYIKNINVSPDGTIWLLNAERGNAVYRYPADSVWHYGPAWKSAEDDRHLLFGQAPETMLFFDTARAIISGTIHAGNQGEGAILRTTDAGHAWQEVAVGNFGKSSTMCTQPNGHAWLAAGREIHHSADFGQTWSHYPLPAINYPITCIAMRNNQQGIAGTYNGQLFTTTNNWQTAALLLPPPVRSTHLPNHPIANPGTQWVGYWQGNIIVQQQGVWYMADTNTQQWQPLPGNVVLATTDSSRQVLYTTDTVGRIMRYTSTTQYAPFCVQPLPAPPQHLLWQNGQLYILTKDMRVWVANDKGITSIPLYTTDRPMTPPEPMYKGHNCTWGTNGRQVFANTGNGWYRAATLPFMIRTIVPDSGNTALVWGGSDEQYVIDATTGRAQPYTPQKPLQAFLPAPITSVTISSITSGCFSMESTTLRYQLQADTTLVATAVERNTNAMQQKDNCMLYASAAEWQRILVAINNAPQYRPSMKDFGITDMDRVAYTEATDRLTYHMDDENTALMTLAEWNNAMLAVDTIGTGLLYYIINHNGSMAGTTNTSLSVTLTNSTGDTLYLRHGYSVSPSPWLLPFYLFYKSHLIACYQPTLAKCIADALPDNFPGKLACHNYVLMMAAARQIMGKNE